MNASQYFRTTYQAARQAYRDAATARGLTVTPYRNPAKGAEGEELSSDMLLIGPADAERLLLVTSGTHGAEGFCGSGIQTSWLAEGGGKQLPPKTAVLMIHAMNPHGFSHVRRVTEDNVDLNRNFVDHAVELPRNPGYDRLRAVICPTEWTEASEARNRQLMRDYATEHGDEAMESAIASGQYVDDKGVFYGGRQPTWSNRTLRAILAPFAATVRACAFVDLHTGLGPYGFGEIMSNHFSRDPGHEMMKQWWGNQATYYDEGTSSSYYVAGDINLGVRRGGRQLSPTHFSMWLMT